MLSLSNDRAFNLNLSSVSSVTELPFKLVLPTKRLSNYFDNYNIPSRILHLHQETVYLTQFAEARTRESCSSGVQLPLSQTQQAHLQTFRVEDETGEDNDAQDEKEDQQRQLLGRRLERVDQDSKPGRVSRQLEQPQDPGYRQDLEIQARLSQELRVKAQRGC